MLALAAVAAVLSIPRVTWRWFGLFTTLVHELGHAFAGLLTGRVLHGIQVRQNQAGSALSSGRGGFSPVFSGFFGYPSPAIVGAALLWCAFAGYSRTAFLVGTIVILLTLVFIRNAFGALVVVGSGLVSGLLWYYGTPVVQGYALVVLGIALLVGAVRGLFTVIGVHMSRRDQLATSDAYLLYRRSGIPSAVWLLAMAAVIAASCWFAWASYLAARPA